MFQRVEEAIQGEGTQKPSQDDKIEFATCLNGWFSV
jgi:hypothetical protein